MYSKPLFLLHLRSGFTQVKKPIPVQCMCGIFPFIFIGVLYAESPSCSPHFRSSEKHCQYLYAAITTEFHASRSSLVIRGLLDVINQSHYKFMVKTLLPLILLFVVLNISTAQKPKWTLSHPTSQSPPLSISGIAPFDSLHAYIVGDFPRIGSTVNGGKSWQYITVKSPVKDSAVRFSAIHFYDALHGWAASGTSGIAYTSDGGITWNWGTVQSIASTIVMWNEIDFADSIHGCAVGTLAQNEFIGLIATTTDGGKSWNTWASDTIPLMSSVRYINSKIIISAGKDQCLLRSVDAGASWTRMVPGKTSNPSKVSILPDGTIAVIDGNRALYSGDGGLTWRIDSANKQFSTIVFTDTMHGISAGGVLSSTNRTNHYTITSDGGATWSPRAFPLGVQGELAEVLACKKAADGSLWLTDSRGMILRTLDAGNSWTNLAGYNVSLRKISFTSPLSGWVSGVANANVLLHTTDGGKHWNTHFPLDTLKDISYGPVFINEQTGWYVSVTKAGVKSLVKTSDGGATWQPLPTLPPSRIIAIFPVSESILIEQSGSPVEWNISKDGGTTWELHEFFNEMSASNFVISPVSGLGIAAGKLGAVGVSRDGGRTWSYAPSAPEEQKQLYIPAIIDDNNWWIGGNEGWLVSTNDGGKTWRNRTASNIPSYTNILNLAFTDAKNGVLSVAGSPGEFYAYMTTDGGDTWFIPETSPLGRSTGLATSLSISPDGTFWVSGRNGMMLTWKPETSGVEEEHIPSNGENALTLSPNPTSTSFTISGIDNIVSVKLMNSLGVEVVSRKLLVVSGKLEVDVSDLASGIYFVQMRTVTGMITKPIVVQR